jgi:hypothetical protein
MHSIQKYFKRKCTYWTLFSFTMITLLVMNPTEECRETLPHEIIVMEILADALERVDP